MAIGQVFLQRYMLFCCFVSVIFFLVKDDQCFGFTAALLLKRGVDVFVAERHTNDWMPLSERPQCTELLVERPRCT